ncbi:MAG: hypothetical protein V2A58_11590 [Planctomycetota bacterium]
MTSDRSRFRRSLSLALAVSWLAAHLAYAEPAPAPEKIVLLDRASGWSQTLTGPGEGSSTEGELAWRNTLSSGPERELLTEITNSSDRLRCLAVEYRFDLAMRDPAPLLAGVNPTPAWPVEGELAYAYVRESTDWVRLSVPFAEVVSPADRLGVSFAPDLADMPILPFEVRLKRTEAGVRVVIRRPQIRLEPNGANAVKLFVARHGGDTREGLAWMRDKWSSLFTVRPGLEPFQYCTWTGGMVDDESFTKVAGENELPRGIWQTRPRPWFGLSCSDHEPWLISCDQKWFYLKDAGDLPGHPGKDAGFDAILKFLTDISGDPAATKILRDATPVNWAFTWQWLTHADVRAYGERVKSAGFSFLYYWNPSETWNKWAEKFYPESLYVPLSQDFWKDSTVLDPFQGSARARDLVADAKRVFDEYPECDGLFMDQVYYDLDNPKHDDGVSIDKDAKPFSRHIWNTYYVIKEIRKLADERHKVLQPNFIFNSIEIASLSDFGLVESVSPMENTGYFYDIGNRLHICQSHEENMDQQASLMGWQTNLWKNPNDSPDDRRSRFFLSKLARPIMMLFQGRAVVLEPDCLALPPGFKGALFKQPSGNYVVTVTTPGASYLSPYSFSDLPVVVRVSDVPSVKRVYQLSSDRLGPVSVPFELADGALCVTIPRHRAISALLLARAGRFVALKDAAALAGARSVDLLREDLDAGSSDTLAADLAPGHPGFAAFSIPADPALTLPRSDIEPDGRPRFEVLLVPEIEVTLAPPPSAVTPLTASKGRMTNDGSVVLSLEKPARFVAAVRNHSRESRNVPLHLSGEGVSVTPGSGSVPPVAGQVPDPLLAVKLPPGACALVDLDVVPDAVGPAKLVVGPPPGAEIRFEIVGSSLADVDPSTAKSAALIVDSVATGGINQKIFLNGVEAGVLVQRIGTPVWDFSARHDLSKESLSALRSENVIEIETGDKKFAVANLKLEVVLADGRRFLVPADPLARSAPPDWLQASGKKVPSGARMRWTLPDETPPASRKSRPRKIDLKGVLVYDKREVDSTR